MPHKDKVILKKIISEMKLQLEKIFEKENH